MRKIRSILLVLFAYLLLCGNALCQHTFDEAINQELYLSERAIVNGTSWTNSVRYEGNRFCGSKEWKTGQLSFDGKKYKNLLINYDLLEDEIILYDDIPGKEKYIQLNKGKIDSFQYIDNGQIKQFVNIELQASAGKEIYEVLYLGKVSYYLRHKKSVQKQIGTTYMGKLYDSNIHYLKTENGSFSVRNKKRVLEILGHSKELKKYIRQHGLTISPKKPNHIIQLIRFSETLSTTN